MGSSVTSLPGRDGRVRLPTLTEIAQISGLRGADGASGNPARNRLCHGSNGLELEFAAAPDLEKPPKTEKQRDAGR